MRTETIEALTQYARAHPDVMLLTADLGYSVLEQFADALPGQYANVGVCEQAMVGIAAGLALSGRQVVVYSIANFPTLRCLEQLRNDVCYHDLPVMVIAVGGGFAYGAQGYTHHGVEDLGIMAMLPNIAVACPADPVEAVALLGELMRRRRPAYLRLGRAGEPVLHAPDAEIAIGQAVWLRRGADVALLATGPVLGRALAAADALAARGIGASVASMPGIRPMDAAAICEAARTHRAVLTIEEHNVDGGFGSRVADVLIANRLAPAFGKWGVTEALRGQVGSQGWMLDRIGDIAEQAAGLL
ncbi:transketolase family protein [Plastoroseomonas arctica]|uniref:Transketolase n=1 Tax=Plastoroseomonas arctica TaxID=1509237 RepID=A0AAF1KPE7_9PROT|nr:transketolase [Plastoroseomonas arctica]